MCKRSPRRDQRATQQNYRPVSLTSISCKVMDASFTPKSCSTSLSTICCLTISTASGQVTAVRPGYLPLCTTGYLQRPTHTDRYDYVGQLQSIWHCSSQETTGEAQMLLAWCPRHWLDRGLATSEDSDCCSWYRQVEPFPCAFWCPTMYCVGPTFISVVYQWY